MTDPARGYSWPAFEDGNSAALTHGAKSPRRIRPLAEELARELAQVAPWACLPSFGATVQAWAWAEAQASLLRSWADESGLLTDDDEALPALAYLERVEVRAGRLRSELGLTPASWAKLVARLRSADGDAALAGLERLKEVGRALTDATALVALPEGDVADE